MYLKSLRISNFRKFGTNNNVIEFVDAQGYEKYKCSEKFNIATTTTLIVGKNNVGKTTVIEVLDKLINRERAFKATDFNFISRAIQNLRILYIDDISGFEIGIKKIFGEIYYFES